VSTTSPRSRSRNATVFGSDVPRLATPAVGRRARGLEAIAFSTKVLNIPLMPWQRYVLDRGCRTRGQQWAHRTVLSVVPRQSGKTTVTACRILAGLMLGWEKQTIAAAHVRDVALQAWRTTVALAEERELPIVRIRNMAGGEELVLAGEHGPVSYKIVSASTGSARGLNADLVVMDEVREYRTREGFATLDKTRRAKPSSQLWCISTEGDFRSVVLEDLQRQGRAAVTAREPGPVAYYEWSAAPERARDDVEGWREANPALGRTISMETLEAEYLVDPGEVFETEVLNRKVVTLSSWLPSGAWSACEDPQASVPPGSPVVFAVDAGPELRHCTIAVAAAHPDGSRVFVEAVASAAGADAPARIEERLHELVERWAPRQLSCLARGPVEGIVHRVGLVHEDVEVRAVGVADLERAARGFYESVLSRRLVHGGDLMLTEHVNAAQRGEPGMLALKRRSATSDMDAAVAAVLAHWGAEHMPVELEPSRIF
jgi:Phage Terminase